MQVESVTEVRYLVDKKGKKTDVVLTLEEYEELMEDLHDLSVALERQNDKRITLRELEDRLKEDGLL
jgi:PHD/YefM family antitoxin component YafN of YafNO toxin-antitoxin module